jgi:Sulfotransferase domain
VRNDDWTGGVRRTSVATRVRARGLDPRRRRGPDFVIIGAQRAGTTSLYQHLLRHPQVHPPLRKEVQFLSVHWDRGLPWYHRHFPVARGAEQRTCEASPYYLFHPAAPVRAAAALPDARFIALLREPSARALSHYAHNRANGVEPLSLDDALAAERDRLDADRDGSARRLYSYVARGLYAEQVSRWRDAVGDRLLVLLSDDLFRDPRQTFDRVQAFVGLDQWEPADFQVHSPHRMIDAPPISASLRRRLQEQFAAPNRALAAVLGRDLSEWYDDPSPGSSPGASLTPQPHTTSRGVSWP